MTLTDAQHAQMCPTCATDDKAAPGRSCAPRACTCRHPECPAWQWEAAAKSGVAQAIHETMEAPGNRTAPAGNRGLTNRTVEES